MLRVLTLFPLVFLAFGCSTSVEHEQSRVVAFEPYSYERFEQLASSKGYQALTKPRAFAFTAEDASMKADSIIALSETVTPSAIDPSAEYDVVVQAGHFGRTSGSTGSAGALLTEQQAAAAVASQLVASLVELDLKVALIGADSYRQGDKRDSQHYFKTKLFLSLHMDGSTTPCAAGPSIGYNPKFGEDKMELIAVAVAISMERNALDFMRNNYTENLSHFYSYKHSNSSIAEGILELGELTCPGDELSFLRNFDVLVDNLSVAITFALGFRK